MITDPQIDKLPTFFVSENKDTQYSYRDIIPELTPTPEPETPTIPTEPTTPKVPETPTTPESEPQPIYTNCSAQSVGKFSLPATSHGNQVSVNYLEAISGGRQKHTQTFTCTNGIFSTTSSEPIEVVCDGGYEKSGENCIKEQEIIPPETPIIPAEPEVKEPTTTPTQPEIQPTTLLETAILRGYQQGLTIYNTPTSFMYDNSIRRDEAAKFFVTFAKLIGKTDYVKTTSECQFSDFSLARQDLKDSITNACRLGLFQ
jgi:hypothetical protein